MGPGVNEFWNDVLYPVLGEAGPWIVLIVLAAAWAEWQERKGNL
jgi:hypothetical protein